MESNQPSSSYPSDQDILGAVAWARDQNCHLLFLNEADAQRIRGLLILSLRSAPPHPPASPDPRTLPPETPDNAPAPPKPEDQRHARRTRKSRSE